MYFQSSSPIATQPLYHIIMISLQHLMFSGFSLFIYVFTHLFMSFLRLILWQIYILRGPWPHRGIYTYIPIN